MARTGKPVLKVLDVTQTFGEKRALDGVSLEVAAGSIFGFVGPNGAGKTTLIRSIVGVAKPDAGDIRIAGQSVLTDALACKRQTAYVPDNPDVYEFLTGMQYLDYIADIFEVPASLRQERIREHAERLGIAKDLGSLISAYSHGMRQKLVLMGALIHEPKLLVLDEPFVGLDPQASYNLKQLMAELTARGSAIFFSSHVLEVVERLCDEVAIIRDGAIVRSGPTAEVCGDAGLEEVFLGLAQEGEPPLERSRAEGEPTAEVAGAEGEPATGRSQPGGAPSRGDAGEDGEGKGASRA